MTTERAEMKRTTIALLMLILIVNGIQTFHFKHLLDVHAQSAHRDAVSLGRFDKSERRITRLELFMRQSLGSKIEVDGRLYWGLVVAGGPDEPDLFVSPRMIAVRTDGKWNEVTK